ncbi:MAG TPA: MAPEG family protein [Gammaproteobacteria bacterium]|nr:MAPEG family protein [Gammaproteobacteria bacterium]
MELMTPILLPCVAMVLLTAVVWVRLYVERIGEMVEKRIHPQAVATSAAAREKLTRTNAADNFRNLFEMPVLFYALCLCLAVTGLGSPWFVTGAWAYVVLRAMHSWIHITYNRVMHRFKVYALSSLLLFGLWGGFAWKLLAAQGG